MVLWLLWIVLVVSFKLITAFAANDVIKKVIACYLEAKKSLFLSVEKQIIEVLDCIPDFCSIKTHT